MNSLDEIREFLGQKRIAVIGVSRNPKDFSRSLFKEFVARGYETVAVNPNATEVDGSQFCPRLADVRPAPDAVLLMTPQAITEDLMQDCAKAGVRHVWIYGYNGRSKVSPLSLSRLRIAGVNVINGECPFMFLNNSGGIHRFHGFVRKVFHSYPR